MMGSSAVRGMAMLKGSGLFSVLRVAKLTLPMAIVMQQLDLFCWSRSPVTRQCGRTWMAKKSQQKAIQQRESGPER